MWIPVLIVLLASAAHGQSRESNPYKLTDREALGKGKQLYSYYCVFCHGMDGVSGRGAQLASKYRKHGSSDREMYRTIGDGVPGTEMSGHWLEEDEIWKILLFVRELEKSAGEGPAGCAGGSGDASRGGALFREKGCVACHSTGSRLGPDLKGVGATRSREHLRESIAEPNKEISRQFRVVRVKTRSGQSARGLIINQDEYTLHLLDASERIRSFQRADLVEIAMPAESMMPSYAGRLAESEIGDMLAYLCAGGAK